MSMTTHRPTHPSIHLSTTCHGLRTSVVPVADMTNTKANPSRPKAVFIHHRTPSAANILSSAVYLLLQKGREKNTLRLHRTTH